MTKKELRKVEDIAKKIVEKLDEVGVYNVGTERKSLRDLAIQEYPEVEEMDASSTNMVYKYPIDSSMRVDI